MSKSLSVLSRSTVNQNVRLEDIDSLPLPQLLKDDCFVNVGPDRFDKTRERHSLLPCHRGCCHFPSSKDLNYWIPSWSKESQLNFDEHQMYRSTLPQLPTDAEWIALPDRETLLKEYRSGTKRHILEACLNPLRFDPSTGLGQVHEWIRRFLYYQDVHGWYSFDIPAICFKTFLEGIKNLSFVVLPYGCIFGYDKESWVKTNSSHMIVVAKHDHFTFCQQISKFETFSPFFQSVKIPSVTYFINTITLISRPYNFSDVDYNIFNRVVWHAVWWMLLLIPQECLDDFVQYNDGQKKTCGSQELEIENCVVRFDPLYQCIGDQIHNLEKHIEQNRPFVYWFGGRVLNVTEIKDVPSFITRSDDPKRTFIDWCVSRGMNTLFNLNGDNWSNFCFKCPCETSDELPSR